MGAGLEFGFGSIFVMQSVRLCGKIRMNLLECHLDRCSCLDRACICLLLKNWWNYLNTSDCVQNYSLLWVVSSFDVSWVTLGGFILFKKYALWSSMRGLTKKVIVCSSYEHCVYFICRNLFNEITCTYVYSNRYNNLCWCTWKAVWYQIKLKSNDNLCLLPTKAILYCQNIKNPTSKDL